MPTAVFLKQSRQREGEDKGEVEEEHGYSCHLTSACRTNTLYTETLPLWPHFLWKAYNIYM